MQELPAGLTARPLTLADAAAAAVLLTVAESVDSTGEHHDADDLAEPWDGEMLDLAGDGRAVCSDDGALAGWGTATPTRTAWAHGLPARA